MEEDNFTDQLPVSVLTGFLGSGKTTVLNHLMQHGALSKTLVLINEFGEIGIDHDLVAQSDEDAIIQMASGCLCCTIRGDLARTLIEAPARFASGDKPGFDRVVIETTGLADPAPILHTLMADDTLAKRFRLDGIIATVDAVNGDNTLDRQVESVKQVAMADRLLITKSDLASEGDLERLKARLRGLNPAAPQVIAQQGVVAPELVLDAGLYDPETKSIDVQGWLRAEAYHGGHHHHDHDHDHDHDVNRHDDHIKALCLTIDYPVRCEAFDAWFGGLLRLRGADFLRVKGIINVVELDVPMVIHGVQHIFHPPITLDAWPSEDRRSRIVFITRDIDEAVLRDTLTMFTDARVETVAADSMASAT